MGMRRRSIEAQARWHRIVQEHADSGQTVAEFCRQRGLAQATFFLWRRRLGHPPAGARVPVAPVFVEARVGCGPDAGSEPQAGIEIDLGRKRRLIVQRGFDPETLSRAIRTLEALA